jgi:hypothetical protein
MAADGKYELAASLLESASAGFDRAESIATAERFVYVKLMEKYQNTELREHQAETSIGSSPFVRCAACLRKEAAARSHP